MPAVFVSDHRRNEELSLRYHRAIAEELKSNPERVLAIASDTLARWQAIHRGTGSIRYLERWDALLRGPRKALLEFMVSPSQEARDMRQCSPFAGVLPEQRRRAIFNQLREEWPT